VIQLLGAPETTVTVGGTYEDPGATATDDVDGDLTNSIVIKNPVDTAIVGNYSITYDAMDSSGNAARQVTRTVRIAAREGQGGGGGGSAGVWLLTLLLSGLLAQRRTVTAWAGTLRR
jgi:hypothetical protein